MLAGIERVGVVKSRKDAVGNLLHNQFAIGFAFLASPKYALRMPLHVVHILFGVIELIVREGDRKTGFYFFCFHSNRVDVNYYAVEYLRFYEKIKSL